MKRKDRVDNPQSLLHLADLLSILNPLPAGRNLTLPAVERQRLFEIIRHMKHKATVIETFPHSFDAGVTALFKSPHGPSKISAAVVLANDLSLPLYRIDLSRVVSKYIGETEKNLERLFEAAEQSDMVLFFDEADPLFGKRSEVKDSHDRYSNGEVAYFFQRLESLRGVDILATNLKRAFPGHFLDLLKSVPRFQAR